MIQKWRPYASRAWSLSRRISRAAVRRGRTAGRIGLIYAVSRRHPVKAENMRHGSRNWSRRLRGTLLADDREMQIKGYTSVSSVAVGEGIDFHVSVNPACDFTVTIYRLGHYGGLSGRIVTTSPKLHGVTQSQPTVNADTGTITCDWSPSWRLEVPKRWTSGLYLAVFATPAGWRNFAPFVVRDQRKADFCVLLPFSTYQAYNQFPLDGRRGKSLYYGYDVSNIPTARNRIEVGVAGDASTDPVTDGAIVHQERARAVSFERPYSRDGLPNRFGYDHNFVRWIEREGFDVTYADSMDLHTGKVDPSRYAGLIFSGHDEYWSDSMREAAERAVAAGTSLAYMTANNVYWHVRIEKSADGRDNRTVVCYKGDVDPSADDRGGTARWRQDHPTGAGRPEHELLGVQYNGVVAEPVPLVVQAADHWFWADTGVSDGDQIGTLVKGEADGFDPACPSPSGVDQTLLSSSPYQLASGETLIQNTSVYETAQGAVVFDASTLEWPAALGHPEVEDARIQQATKNLLNRILRSG